MLRVISHTSAAGAVAYFNSALKHGDYYLDQAEFPSMWQGYGVELLGLGEEVTAEDFTSLVHNKNPLTGEKLTQRNRDGRIVAYELNFNSVKSLSLLHALTGDSALLTAFREAVSEEMIEIEKLSATRVRRDGQQADRVVGNLLWANFIHATTRPVNGIPDPHLHCHNYCINAVFDHIEEKWKAGKFHDIKKNAPLHEAAFHARLTKKLVDFGFSIRRTKNAWEIVGISDALVEKFSRRLAQIDAYAEKHGITNAKDRDGLGAKTRAGKNEGMSKAELFSAWVAMMHPDELESLLRTHREKPKSATIEQITAGTALSFAEAKIFQNDSVVKKNKLLIEALRYGVGHILPEDVQREFNKRGYIERHVDGNDLVTTPALVREEAELVCRVRDGRNQYAPIHPGRVRISRSFLSKEQKNAVRKVLKSGDQVIALRGLAGVGKTTSLQEVRDQVEGLGLKFFAFAPTNRASKHVLRKENFVGADTVAHLIQSKKLQDEIRSSKGSVILIDEAGTLGILDLLRVMEIAGDNSRVILSGDTAQHLPVARGDALCLIERYAGLPVITIAEIRRQVDEQYRKAVVELAAGNVADGFALLEDMGAIAEIPDAKTRYGVLAAEWLHRLETDKAAPLVVSPTHAEGGMVTSAIRGLLKDSGKLGKERDFLQYRHVRMTDADKTRPELYAAGMVIKANQNMKGVKRGSMLTVFQVDDANRVWVGLNEKSLLPLDLTRAKDFEVFEVGKISLAKGDLLKLTTNGRSENGRRFYNGEIHEIHHIGRDGKLTLSNGSILSSNFGHFQYGYCQTSHVSQGSTSQHVFLAQSADSAGAASMEQAYVSVSRGKVAIKVFTDDRVALQEAVGNSSRRMSALELSGLGEELFMPGLDGTKWAERLAEYRMERHNGSHVQKLASDRRVDPLKKPEEMTFTAYIEMRRANVTADGRSRSKGMPASESKERFKGVTVPRKIEMRVSLEDRQKAKAEAAAKEAERKTSQRESRIGRAMESVKSNFKEVMEKGKQRVAALKDSADRFVRLGKTAVKSSDLNGEAAQKANIQRQARLDRHPKPQPKPPTPTPTIRRGK